MTRLKDAIENRAYSTPLAQVHARTWLIHWSLFVFFNHENGRNSIIDLFFQERYMHSIQAEAGPCRCCPPQRQTHSEPSFLELNSIS
jgi:translation initiation factor 3 subunit E